MKVKYVGIDGKIGHEDEDVTIGKVYDVVTYDDRLFYPVGFIDDVGVQQCFNWNVLEIVEEVKEMFDVKDLKSGMVVEWQGKLGGKYIDLLFESHGKIFGLTLGSKRYTRKYEHTSILRVWHPTVTCAEEIHNSLNDRCLIYDHNSEMIKLARQKEREIEKLHSELSEIKSKLRELGAE